MGSLTGKRILIVEDEYFIASDLSRMLKEEDAMVIGPVSNVDAGMALAEHEPLDAAVLDVNLEEALSYPIAERLAQRDVPYMFLTGYDGWSLPAGYRETPRLAKPFVAHAVISMVARMCGESEQ